jgi:hypothetical protein
MKIAVALLVVAISSSAASAQYFGNRSGSSSGLYGTGSNPNSHYVAPSFDTRGNYRDGHRATNPNNTQLDNYSTKGNINPYTGEIGTRRPRY